MPVSAKNRELQWTRRCKELDPQKHDAFRSAQLLILPNRESSCHTFYVEHTSTKHNSVLQVMPYGLKQLSVVQSGFYFGKCFIASALETTVSGTETPTPQRPGRWEACGGGGP